MARLPLSPPTDLGHDAIEAKVIGALEDVRLDASYATRFSDQLSGGERQRVAIARALVASPKLLLCDEVLSALDVSVQANVLSLLQRLRGEHNLSMLFISHDLAVVRSLADRVGVLFRGRLMEIGPVEEIFKPPFHPYTYELLMAVPSINRIGAARMRDKADRVAKGTQGCAFAGRCQWQLGSLCETASRHHGGRSHRAMPSVATSRCRISWSATRATSRHLEAVPSRFPSKRQAR